jgi:hypothetical protein
VSGDANKLSLLSKEERFGLIAQGRANMFMEQLRAKLKQKFSFCASQESKYESVEPKWRRSMRTASQRASERGEHYTVVYSSRQMASDPCAYGRETSEPAIQGPGF